MMLSRELKAVILESKIILIGVVAGQLLTTQPPFPFSPGFDIQKVASLAESRPSHTWEYGAAAQALLELHNAPLSVFGDAPFPVPCVEKEAVKGLAYAASKITFGCEGANGLSNDHEAVGDAASLGVSLVMLGKKDPRYAQAAQVTVDFLMNSAPRYPNGAISQRVSTPELWADFVYMAPPFLAYYAADSSNETLLRESVEQCRYYREVLQANTTMPYKGVWERIIGPKSQDAGLWSTGNGWAAAGMTRVLATVMKAPIAQNASWKLDAIQDLTFWIMEILNGAMASSPDRGLLRNFLNDTDLKGHGFGEISGSSLLASVVYRMAVLQPQACGDKYVRWADGIRGVLAGNDENGQPHITKEGVATPAVNPAGWLDTEPFVNGSPEGQAFVVLMYAAWRDCVLDGHCSSHSPGVSRRVDRRRRRDLDDHRWR
ncbi:hypothetical protein D9615_004857 [Tricholomella constricta]|uniref:Uncharacterized protein n=1 Tax=Tricholomella constricta TaxID=117010 RepID=A0A8H5M6G6_9AGAR|nr:hypothetical protein D9615_004857 [Tricholomella constricta]